MTSHETSDPTPQLRLYRNWLARELELEFSDYASMWEWSIREADRFWQSIWAYFDLNSPTPHGSVMAGTMPNVRWFPGANVNYAQQVFRHADRAEAVNQPAIIAENERGQVVQVSWPDLRRRAASLALELRTQGVGRGDRVAAYLPNIPEAVIGMLACVSIGAVWTMCSPDMGTRAVLDRFRQVAPKALIAADGVYYGGKAMDRSSVVEDLRKALPSVKSLFLLRTEFGDSDIPEAHCLQSAQSREDDEVLSFEPEWVPFDHPLWILYSSGTTGLPKAIVHGHGGIILATCAGALHFDLGPSYEQNTFADRFHWYSATGWVMWNIQVGGLLTGTTICLFDGSPGGTKSTPDWSLLWSFAARHRVTWFGAGAAFFSSCRDAGLVLGENEYLGAVRALGSTGSPLPSVVQLWGTDQFVRLGRADIWWCNVSGGTDIAAAFMAGNRELPAAPGRLQCRHLGAAVESWDERGRALISEVGELVCVKPFPSMPLFFWGDDGGERYHASYFNKWPGVWRHGDWLEIDIDGVCTISGRSDATINRNGLRMGTADIYSAIEDLSEVADSLLVDIEDGEGGSKLLMFVVPGEAGKFGPEMTTAIANGIRETLSPRFVPDEFICAPDIPRTLSGKKQEVPVKRLFQGWPVEKVINPDLIANPDVIPWYEERARQWRKRASRSSAL